VDKRNLRLLSIALAISALLNLYLAYRLLDLGVTSTYAADELQRRGAQVSALQRLLPLLMPNTSRHLLISTAQAAGLEVLDKGDEGVYVEEILFVISNDQVG